MKNIVKDATVEYKPIREWREDDRPREKLAKHGASVLSDTELLAILIQNGTVRFSAIDIAKALLEKYESLAKLASGDISEFRHIKGIGKAKAITLAAAFELGRRIANDADVKGLVYRSPDDISNYFRAKLTSLRTEVFLVLILNARNQVLREIEISNGSLTSTIVHPREVFRIAIAEGAASIIILHNHPSGSSAPSKDDIEVTRTLVKAGKIINIQVLDHVIIAKDGYSSLLALGYI